VSESVPVVFPGETTPEASGDWSTEPLWPELHDFRLIRKIGEGAMGAVFKARQISSGRRVAIKVIFPHLARNTKVIERFYREARTMGLLEHPNIVQAYGVGEENGYHYFAMEYVNGRSVQSWLLELGQLSVGDALHITLACARALDHAHRLELVHRDIKPDNILITRSGEVKLTDFGMVKLGLEDVSLTQTGHAVGTPTFMPLEQARNSKDSDGRSDIYALGCTLYCMLTGQPPFRGPTLVEMIQAKEVGSFPPARRSNLGVSDRLDLMIYKMTAKSVSARYQTCTELIHDLQSLRQANRSLSFVLPNVNAPVDATTPLPETSPGREQKEETTAKARGRDQWYLRYRTRAGELVTEETTTAEILKRIEDELFDLTAKASHEPDDGYQFLVSIREFRPALLSRVTRIGADRKTSGYRNAFRQIEQADRKRRNERLPRRGLREFIRDWQTELLILSGVVGTVLLIYLLNLLFFEQIRKIFID
jgi:serine/threonine-protein kinase